jgi:hypothetical protein
MFVQRYLRTVQQLYLPVPSTSQPGFVPRRGPRGTGWRSRNAASTSSLTSAQSVSYAAQSGDAIQQTDLCRFRQGPATIPGIAPQVEPGARPCEEATYAAFCGAIPVDSIPTPTDQWSIRQQLGIPLTHPTPTCCAACFAVFVPPIKVS